MCMKAESKAHKPHNTLFPLYGSEETKNPFRPVLIAHETARQLREQTWSLKYGCFHTWARWLAAGGG